MRVLHAKEYGLINGFDLRSAGELRSDVLAKEYVSVRRTKHAVNTPYEPLMQSVFAGGVVGLLPLTRHDAVMVEPRYPVNLARMVEKVGADATALDFSREYSLSQPGDSNEWILLHLCESFLASVEAVIGQGLYRTYARHQEATSSPQGRLLVGQTISRHIARNEPYRAEVTYFVRSEVNPANQALVEGLHWVRAYLTGKSARELKALRRRAEQLLFALRFVDRDPTELFKRDPRVLDPRVMPSSRSAYRRALPLAVALLDQRGVTLDAEGDDISLNSLLIRTDDVFEEYVRQMLTEGLPDRTLAVVDGNKMRARYFFDEVPKEQVPVGARPLRRGSNKIKPDILIEDMVGRTLLVADVKYIEIGSSDGDGGHAGRGALDQIVTYAHRLGCDVALSIHPAVEGQLTGLFLSGQVGTTKVFNYRVDLSASDLEAEMRKMVESLDALAHL